MNMRFATRFASATLLVFFAACAPAPDNPAAKAAIPVPEKDKFEPKDSPAFDAAFWETWGDGSAELAAYDLTYTRYGRTRGGTAVTIFVSETFSSDARVKADSGKHPPRDEFPVMKLNLVQDFPTGIYDYNLMTSVFVSAKAANDLPAGTATKVSFSAQEWCGHVYMQALFDSHAARLTSHSYFDGEGDQQSAIEQSRDRLSEDALMHWARGMARPVLKPGESKRIEMLASLERARLTHKPLTNVLATLRRAAKPSMAGGIEVEPNAHGPLDDRRVGNRAQHGHGA